MGTRNPYPTGFRCFWDHPHAYGDKQESLYAVSRSIGSSPRVWGQGIQHSNNAVIVGIIPTRMGTSALFSPFLVSPWDHPHAYGDKRIVFTFSCKSVGSSPRVWGQASSKTSPTPLTRIIPTRMGTRTWSDVINPAQSYHPHAYGDKKSPAVLTAPSTGSSPRVWGQGLRVHHRRIQAGIIPTRMGTSNTHRSTFTTYRDHPHAYGDKYNTIQSKVLY